MFKNHFYLDIVLMEQNNTGLVLMTQVISNIHRLMRHHKVQDVGLVFPDFGALCPKGKSTLGETVRLVSVNKENLSRIASNVTFRTLEKVGVLSFSEVKAVPDEAIPVRFFKDARPNRQRREAVREGGVVPAYEELAHSSACILIQRTDGSVYPIFIGKMDGTSFVEGEFNSYGLSNKTGPTVPFFKS